MGDPQALMGSLILIAGVVAIVYAIVFVRLPARRTHTWPTVTGAITHSGVKARSGHTAHDNPNTVYEADVQYRYTVGGREYRGNTIRRGGNLALSLPGRAAEMANRFREGDDVDVYYDPAKPTQSCLLPGEEVSLFIIGVGAIFCLVGWFMA